MCYLLICSFAFYLRELSDNSNLLTPEIVAQIPGSAKESDSDKTQNKEKYKKSLRLTSEQIVGYSPSRDMFSFNIIVLFLL